MADTQAQAVTRTPPAPDQGWSNFVDQQSQNQQQAASDPRWQSFVQDRADQAITPKIPPPTTAGETAGAIVKPLLPAFEAITSHIMDALQPPQVSPEVSGDTTKFRNSKDFKEGAANFAQLANDAVLKPAVQSFVDTWHHIGTQAQSAVAPLNQPRPVDEYGQPTAESATEALEGTLNVLGALFGFVGAPVSAVAQTASKPVFEQAGLTPEQAEVASQGFGAGAGGLVFPMAVDMAFRTPGTPVNTLARAKASGVLDGEEAYFGTKELPPEQQAAIDAARELTTPRETPLETTTSPFDIHAAARNIDPETFDKYDRLQATQETLRNNLAEAQAAKTADLDAQIKEIQDAKQGGYGKLQSLIEKRDALRAEDTPEMAEIRQKMQENDYAMRDLAPRVSEAYRQANEFAPEEHSPQEEDTAETPEEAAARRKGEVTHGNYTIDNWLGRDGDNDVTPVSLTVRKDGTGFIEINGHILDATPQIKRGLSPEETIAEILGDHPQGAKPDASKVHKVEESASSTPIKPIEEQRQAIISDFSQRAAVTGRPQEEIDAQANIEASFFQTLAEQYPKFSAEEWYSRERADIKGPRQTTPVLAQGEQESIPGTEPSAKQAAEAGEAVSEGRLRGKKPQKPANEGLFSNERDQGELLQANRGKIRLATDENRALITSLKNANASTWIHESGHHYTDILFRLAKEDDAPQSMKDDAATLKKWAGIPDEADVRATEGKKYVYEKQLEKIADGFLRYLREGTAPSRALANVFAKFKQWLSALYKTADHVGVDISDDVRDVYARLLSSKPEKTVIAPEHEPGSLGANIHEQDAEETPAENAEPVADNIQTEVNKTALTHDQETTNVLKSADEAGTVAETPQIATGTGGTAPGEGAIAQEPSKVNAGGNKTAAQGAYERVPRKPLSLADFVRKNGGVKDEGGDVLASLGGKKDGKLIRPKSGLALDHMALKAWEAGYFPEKGDERPSIEEFKAKLHEDINGQQQYSAHDLNKALDYNNVLAKNAETDRLTLEFGIDTKGKTSAQVYDEIAEHMSVEKQAKEAKEIGDAYEEQLEKAEKLARPEAWEPEEEEKLENDRQQEITARGPEEGATGAGATGDAGRGAGTVEGGAGQSGRAPELTGRTEAERTVIANDAQNATGNGAEPTEPNAGRNVASPPAEGARASTEGEPATPTTQLEAKPYFIDKKGVINFDLFKTPEDIQRYLQEWADKNPDKISEARGGKVTLDQTVKLAQSMGMTVEELNARKVGELYDGPKQVAAAQLFIQSAKRIKDAAEAARASGDPQQVANFFADLEDHKDFMDMFLQQVGISAEASRALGARRAIRQLGGFQEAMDIGELFQRMTGVNMKDAKAQADLFASLDSPEKISKLAQKTREADWRDYAIAYRNNDILSGPVTHLHYADGNLVNLLYKPSKVVVASLLPGGPKLGEAGAMFNSMIMGAQKGWQVAKAAWQDGLDRSYQDIIQNYKRPTQVEYNPTFNKYLGPGSPVGRSIGAIHSFFYTMNLEQVKAQLAFRQALTEGLEEKTDAFNNRISDLITNPTKEMLAKADADAKESMYLKNPEYGSALYNLNQFANRSYVGRALIPFAKISMNVKLLARDNTLLGLFNKDVRADLMGVNGSEAQAIRIASMGMGTSMFGIAMAAGDLINGNGPSDPKARNVWLLTHTPNSIQIGHVAIPLLALGTPGVILMAGAEMREAFQDATEEESQKAAAAFMQHVSRVLFEGTFIQNTKSTVDALFHPEEYGSQFLQNTAAGFVPYSSLLGQVNRYIDPFQRDVHSHGLENVFGVTDYIKSRIPFASETLPERVDALGNPIPNDRWLAAGSYSQYASNPIVQKLNSLGVGITKPKRDIMGIPLTDQQYHDYSVTAGQLVQKNLEWMVNSQFFDQMPQGAKVKEVNKAIGEAHKYASQEMMFLNPEIMQQAAAKKEASFQ